MFDLIKVPVRDNEKPIIQPFLCHKIKQFGFCQGKCSERHNLCKSLDVGLLNIPPSCFISFQLMKIHSASHFHGRILKYSTSKDPTKNQDWTSFNDSFERIKDELKNISMSPKTKVLHKNPIVGDMVMVETGQAQLHRATVLNLISGWFSLSVKVKLIDLGCIVEVDSNKVFEIPSHLKEFCPVAIEIIISSMRPIEECSILDWSVGTTNLVRRLLEPIILSDLQLISKVQISMGSTVWIDWMLVKKCINCSHFACNLYKNPLILPTELIKHNLAKTSSQVIDKLKDLNKGINVWEENNNVEKFKTESTIKTSNISLFSSEKQKIKIDEVIKPQWAHLSEKVINNVSVDFVLHPKCILVRDLKFLDRIKALQNDIDVAIENKAVELLTTITVGTVCLALSPDGNNYNRVLIKLIHDDETADVLYVDYGEICTLKIETLFSIPLNLITKLPFQVIECSLSGFKDVLPTDDFDQFIERFMELTSVDICLKVISSSTDPKLTEGNYYEVVLFNNDINVNAIIADEFNAYVDHTQIQNILSMNYEVHNNKEYEYDEEYDELELESQCELLNSLLKNHTKSHEKPIESNLNLGKMSNYINNQNIEEEKVKIEKKYCLTCNTTPVVPQCFWHQDKVWIYLQLNILSITNYNITHTTDTITVDVETNTASYSFTAVLFAFIFEESFTSQVSYNGLSIKAKKLFQCDYQWPRLVKCPKRHKYLIYNTEYLIEHKNWKLWTQKMTNYKTLALNEPSNKVNWYDDESSDNSDSDEYAIVED